MIKKHKHHFHKLKSQVNIVLGHNGIICLSNVDREGLIGDNLD